MNPRDYGQPNPKAPKELSQFGFLIGAWKCDIKVKGEDGTYDTHKGSWAARYILDGYVIADEFRQTGPNGELVRLGTTYRSYNADQKRWVMKWLDAMNSTLVGSGPRGPRRRSSLDKLPDERSGVWA